MESSNAILIAAGIIALISSGVFLYKHKTLNKSEYYSTLTTIGILGTFTGIAFGLYNFNIDSVEISIPELLSGLSTAFYTSILALGLGLLVRIYYTIRNKKTNTKQENPAQGIIEILDKQYEQSKKSEERSLNLLEKIAKGILGDSDGSLLTQIKLLRVNLDDNFTQVGNRQEQMIKEFNQFAQKMAENNYNALITALKEVIKDFNAKINEQFGENFKHLNEGVTKLLEWQGNYKDHVDQMEKQFDISVQALSSSSSALEQINQDISNFDSASENLNTLVTDLNKKLVFFETGLSKFNEVSEKASQSFDQIEANVIKLTSGFEESSSKFLKYTQESIEKMIDGVEEEQNAFRESTTKSTNEAHALIKGIVEDSRKEIGKHLTELDKQLGDELNKSLSTLGNQLAALSNKFVSDYTPLTNKLRQIVNISNGVKNGSLSTQ